MAFKEGSVERHVQAVVAALTGIVLSQHGHLLESGCPVGLEDGEQDEEWEVALLSFNDEPTAATVGGLAKGYYSRETRGKVKPIERERRAEARRKF